MIFGPPEERTLVQQEEHEETRFENFVGTPTSLADHLDEQLRLTVVDADVRAAAEEIIGNVDDDGYLRATLEEIAEKRGCRSPSSRRRSPSCRASTPSGWRLATSGSAS